MKTPTIKPFMYFGIFILLFGLACGTSVSPTPTDVPTQPPPTQPPPTEPPTPTEPSPTQPPPPTDTPPAPTTAPDQPSGDFQSAFEIDPNPYVHGGNLFSFNPPMGWSINEDSGSVSISAPDDSGFIYMQVTNVGYTFDENAFGRFVDAREQNFFGKFEGYQELERKIEGTVATVSKSVMFQGTPQLVLTVYNQRDQAVYALDFWADQDKFSAYSPKYVEIIETLNLNSAAVSQLEPYAWVYDFTGPANLFTFQVPSSWRYERNESETVVIDTFYAPDNHAVIQNIGYDDGTQISKSQAGAFALTLLKEAYADDITITDDQVQPDGSERLTWNSPGGDFSGISFFESRGTTFLIFTVMWDNPFADIYVDVLDYTVSTYDIPQ